MLQNVWRSVQLWVQAPRKCYQRNSDPGDIIILLGGEQDVMDVVELQVHLKFIQYKVYKYVELRFRKVMHLQSVRSRDYSEEKKSAISYQEM